LTILAVSAFAVLSAGLFVVVALTIFFNATSFLAITSLHRRSFVLERQGCFYHHLINCFSSHLAELRSIVAALTVAPLTV